jgi:iron-regulated transporter 1
VGGWEEGQDRGMFDIVHFSRMGSRTMLASQPLNADMDVCDESCGKESCNQPYQQMHKLYTCHAAYAFVSRSWEMSIVLLTAAASDNSLTFVALSGFLSSLSLFLFMPSIGKCLDRTARMTVVIVALFLKLFFLTCTYVACSILLAEESDNRSSFDCSMLYMIPVFYACASLCFCAITQSIEKDWLVVLSNGNSCWLTSTNSVMSQIDLAANALGPVFAGCIMSFFSPSMSSLVFLGSNAVVTGLLFGYLRCLYTSWPALAVRVPYRLPTPRASCKYQSINNVEESNVKYDGTSVSQDEEITKTNASLYLRVIDFCSLSEFYDCGCGGVMLSYSFLYATVLSFGSLMMVYLRWAGLPDHLIGVARGVSSMFGFLGAFVFPMAKQTMGIRKTGLCAIWYQCLNVCIAAAAFVLFSKYKAMMAVTILTVHSPT